MNGDNDEKKAAQPEKEQTAKGEVVANRFTLTDTQGRERASLYVENELTLFAFNDKDGEPVFSHSCQLEWLRYVERKFAIIIFENLNIRGMLKNHCLAKSIADAAWNQLIRFTSYKAENAGRCAVQANPRNTSQICSGCGEIVEKDLSVRIHACSGCGLRLHRDHNAARNILALGLQSVGQMTIEAVLI